MKNKILFAAAAVAFAFAVAVFSAFYGGKNVESVKSYTDADGGNVTVFYTAPTGREDRIVKTWTHDTLTTTEIDTLNLTNILASPYQYSYQMKIAKISGTPSLKVVLDQKNVPANSDWIGIDSVAVSGADSTKTYWLIKGANTWGIQHRLRLVGTTGVNQYDITANLKRTF